jgi:hypothetical protein
MLVRALRDETAFHPWLNIGSARWIESRKASTSSLKNCSRSARAAALARDVAAIRWSRVHRSGDGVRRAGAKRRSPRHDPPASAHRLAAAGRLRTVNNASVRARCALPAGPVTNVRSGRWQGRGKVAKTHGSWAVGRIEHPSTNVFQASLFARSKPSARPAANCFSRIAYCLRISTHACGEQHRKRGSGHQADRNTHGNGLKPLREPLHQHKPGVGERVGERAQRVASGAP